MGFQARRGDLTGMLAALIQGLNDSRKSPQVCQAFVSGVVTLASGIGAITNAKFTSQTVFQVQQQTPSTTIAPQYRIQPSAGAVTITGINLSGATVTQDNSGLTYEAATPLYHGDQTTASQTGDSSNPQSTLLTVSAAAAVDLPSTIALANNIRQVLILHLGDAVAHLLADTTNGPTVSATTLAVDQTSANNLLNSCQSAFNAHLTQAGVHVNNDTSNTNSTAAATNAGTSQTLANALKTSINTHLASAPTGESITLYGP